MDLRTKIAKWLAPEVFRKAENMATEAEYWEGRASMWSERAMKRGIAINAIISRATSRPNSTVKAMVKIAQDALETKEQANG